ncbi:MAG: c-type cytochrome [Gammaproteobacteria bacterium]
MRALLRPALLLAAVLGCGNPALAADGAAVFRQHCLMCHQSGGAGLSGQFPRLAGRVAAIAAVPEARPYLVQVLSYGMSGSITVDGQALIGMMPGFAQIPDADLAALLDYLVSLGKAPRKAPAPFSAEEVKAARTGAALSATEVLAARERLGIAGIAP